MNNEYEIKKENINLVYETISKGIFPFISSSRVTILGEGFYKKANSKYCGLTMKFHNGEKLCYLMGYYYVPLNCIIIPSDINLNPKHLDIIKKYPQKGYQILNKVPSLSLYTFDKDTKEYEVADYFYESYNKIKNGNSNNKSYTAV